MEIKKYRKASGLSQQELADKLNVNRSTVAYWEKGIALPRAEMIPKVADALACTIDALYGRDPMP